LLGLAEESGLLVLGGDYVLSAISLDTMFPLDRKYGKMCSESNY
jgi:hypothetical protein